MEEKVLSLGKFSAVASGNQLGLAPQSSLLKIFFFEHHVTTRKRTMIQKGITAFNPTYLTKVTVLALAILKLLLTETLVVQVLNTRFNIQSLHL